MPLITYAPEELAAIEKVRLALRDLNEALSYAADQSLRIVVDSIQVPGHIRSRYDCYAYVSATVEHDRTVIGGTQL